MTGLLSLVRSRKFWLALAGIAAAVGLAPEDQTDRLAESIVFIVGVLIAAIGIEDHGKEGK
jgi:hypothetical protein